MEITAACTKENSSVKLTYLNEMFKPQLLVDAWKYLVTFSVAVVCRSAVLHTRNILAKIFSRSDINKAFGFVTFFVKERKMHLLKVTISSFDQTEL